MLGPIGLGGMNARRGEVQAVRAAEKAGIPFALSNNSACSIEEVAQGASKPFWFQAYMVRDRAFMADILARAKAAGCNVLLFTVDLPVGRAALPRPHRTGLAGAPGCGDRCAAPRRRCSVRNGRGTSAYMVARTVSATWTKFSEKESGINDFFGWMSRNFDSQVTWKDLDFLRDHWDGPLVIKGILDVEERAQRRLDRGGWPDRLKSWRPAA